MPASDYELFLTYEAFGANEPGTGTQGHVTDFVELYRGSGASQLDPDADKEMFFQFLNAFVPDTERHNKEWWQEIRQDFYDLAGISEDEIDWEAYREAIGYGSS